MHLAEIVITSGTNSGQTFPVNVNKFLIGRERDCHFRPDDELISRHHCVVIYDGITYRIRDLGSRNGTLVNGTVIQGDVILVPDDVVKIGSVTFQLSLVAEQSMKETTTHSNSLNQTDIMDGTTLTVPPNENSIKEDTKNIQMPEESPASNDSSQ